ncbi:hypothetical protein ACSYDW_14505 [Paeniglutamicibacter sp. R2-26]|uniref:8-oxoguanine DNA glycosylase OGG fold protein n=1 Tax=Paeniglutamicibacter sp. R2-26 TaxID=3144417 RepID=UPI003EE73449
MTTLATPEAPDDLRAYPKATPRAQAIDEHGFDLNLLYWNIRIGHLPGAPVRGLDGATDKGRITRGSMFAMADAALEDDTNEAAYALLWRALAWGSGNRHRNTTQRITSVEADVHGIGTALRRAATLSRTEPEAAFRTLQPFNPLVKYLGPNFFTKFLYAAGAGNPEHPCLIVDERVLKTLSRYTAEPLTPKYGSRYGYGTYSAANEVMASWARELSTPERKIGFDEVERWAFNVGD